jgi:ZIP family zinc transporter
MLGLRYFTQRLEKQQEASPETSATMASANASLPWGLLVAIGIDILIDGLLLGIGFAAGAKDGTLLAIALTIELLSLGLATAVELRDGGHSKGGAVAIVAGTSLMLLLGAGIVPPCCVGPLATCWKSCFPLA